MQQKVKVLVPLKCPCDRTAIVQESRVTERKRIKAKGRDGGDFFGALVAQLGQRQTSWTPYPSH